MGNTESHQRMVVERLIAGKPHHICLGVHGQTGRETNPYRNQVIRVGESGPLRSMIFFQETEQSIQCGFEGDIHLKFMRKGNDIVYFLSTPDFNITDLVVPFVRQTGNLSFHSTELDRIFTFIRLPDAE